jgi:hypothetical protein
MGGEQVLIWYDVACLQTFRQFKCGHVPQLSILQLLRAAKLVEVDEQKVFCMYGAVLFSEVQRLNEMVPE